MKKLLLGLGAMTAIAAPVVVAVSCGDEAGGTQLGKPQDISAKPATLSDDVTNGKTLTIFLPDFEASINEPDESPEAITDAVINDWVDYDFKIATVQRNLVATISNTFRNPANALAESFSISIDDVLRDFTDYHDLSNVSSMEVVPFNTFWLNVVADSDNWFETPVVWPVDSLQPTTLREFISAFKSNIAVFKQKAQGYLDDYPTQAEWDSQSEDETGGITYTQYQKMSSSQLAFAREMINFDEYQFAAYEIVESMLM